VTQTQLIKLILIVITLHILFIIVFISLRKFKCWLNKILKRIFKLFHIAIYLRILLESFVLSFLLAANEVSRENQAPAHSISYFIAVVYMLLWVAFFLFLIIYYKKSKDVNKSLLLNEIYEGLQNKPSAKNYYVVFLLRRVLMVFVILWLRDSVVIVRLLWYLSIQIVVLLFDIISRPFDGIQQNLSDTMNDFIYVCGTVILILIQDEDLKTIIPSTFLIYMLIWNCLVICLINLFFFGKNAIKHYRLKYRQIRYTLKQINSNFTYLLTWTC